MEKRRLPNIIFVVLDTQRVDRLSCYGYPRPTSPRLDDLAGRAALFEMAVSPAQWTIPAHASMFTGQYPLLHQTVQSDRALPAELPTVTEMLRQNGYHTFGFCNNPLVGVLNNGLQRGFDRFFNYASFVPDLVPAPKAPDSLFGRAREKARGVIQYGVREIERQFGKSERLLALSQESFFVPFWSRLGNFKGDIVRCMGDMVRYVKAYHDDERPYFLFLNAMETHLPYWPAQPFVRKYAQWVRRDKYARRFMSLFNTQAYRWATPVINPFSEMEKAAIDAMYDAEVAFQDHHVGRLFAALDELNAWDDTLVVVVADHGEGFGEHNYMGHAFALFQEVVHVPLVVHFPGGEMAGRRVPQAVSTRRIFHTMLQYAGIPYDEPSGSAAELSLRAAAQGRPSRDDMVVSEAYSPTNFVSVIERRDPSVLVPYKCLSLWRAAYQGGEKLIAVDNQPEKFFNLVTDPAERVNLLGSAQRAPTLFAGLSQFVADQQQYARAAGTRDAYSPDEEADVREHLRALGYLE